MGIIERTRNFLPESARESWYRIGGALVIFFGSWGYLDGSEVQQWSALVAATVTLLFAALYSTSTVRTALYLFLVAVQGVAGLYGILDDQRWGGIVTLAAFALGVTTAAAKTVVIDGQVESVTTTELGVDSEVARDAGGHDIAEPPGRHRLDD